MAYDIPGETGGTTTDGTSTRRENNTTLTDQALSVPINADTLDEVRPRDSRNHLGNATGSRAIPYPLSGDPDLTTWLSLDRLIRSERTFDPHLAVPAVR